MKYFLKKFKTTALLLVSALALAFGVIGVGSLQVDSKTAAADDAAWVGSSTEYTEYTEFVQENGVTNIEDLIGSARNYKFIKTDGAGKTEDGNFYLESQDWAGGLEAQYCRSIRVYSKFTSYVTRYKVKYEGGCMMLMHELRGVIDSGLYWAESGNLAIMIRVCSDNNEITTGFSTNGMNGLEWSKVPNLNLKLTPGGYAEVEVGCIDIEGGILLSLKITDMETGNSAVAQGKKEGSFAQAGFFTIYNSPFNKCYVHDNAQNLMQTVTIEGIEAPSLSKWVFEPEIDPSYAKYDVSEVIPVGEEGKTYVYGTNDKVDSPNRALFGVKVDKLNYSVAFKMKAENTATVNFSLALRSSKLGDTTGYKVAFKSGSITIAKGEAQAVAIEPNKEYKVEVGCTDYYLQGEAVASGAYVFVKMDDAIVAEAYIDPADSEYAGLSTGNYLTGILRGDKGGSLSLKPLNVNTVENTVEIKATRMSVPVNKITRLEGIPSLETLLDEISYEIVEGEEYATLEGNGLTGKADGIVKVRAKVSNTYGDFYSDAIEITVGTGAPVQEETESTGGGIAAILGGCSSFVGSASAVVTSLVVLGAFVILKKKEN